MSSASSSVPTPLRALLVAAAVLFVGAAILQRAGPAGRSDPIASVDNGGPRGLLLLALALQDAGRPIIRVESDAGLEAATRAVAVDGALDDVVVIVPPPEQTPFSAAEALGLKGLAARGARVVVLCDPDGDRKKRLRQLLDGSGVRCVGTTDAVAEELPLTTPPAQLLVHDGGRVSIDEEAKGVLPLSSAGEAAGIGSVGTIGRAGAVIVVDRGDVVVLGSASALANDGLVAADNARVLWWLLDGRRRVIVDERHHLSRGAAAWQRASLEGPGPITALACALLLVPLMLLSLAPRRGELLTTDGVEVPAAVARVRGLAALLASSGNAPSSSSLPPSSASMLSSTTASSSSSSSSSSSERPRPGASP